MSCRASARLLAADVFVQLFEDGLLHQLNTHWETFRRVLHKLFSISPFRQRPNLSAIPSCQANPVLVRHLRQFASHSFLRHIIKSRKPFHVDKRRARRRSCQSKNLPLHHFSRIHCRSSQEKVVGRCEPHGRNSGGQDQRLHYTAVLSGGQPHLRKKRPRLRKPELTREDAPDPPDFRLVVGLSDPRFAPNAVLISAAAARSHPAARARTFLAARSRATAQPPQKVSPKLRSLRLATIPSTYVLRRKSLLKSAPRPGRSASAP
jgi:hypothetical protein